MMLSKKLKRAEINMNFVRRKIDVDYTLLSKLSDKTISWDKEDAKPEMITTLISDAKNLFQLQEDVTTCKATLIPPTSDQFNIEKTMLKTGYRIVLVVGTNESFKLTASSATKTLMLSDGEAFGIPFCYASGINIEYDNSSIKTEFRKGFRQKIVRKNVSKRHILILDYNINSEKVVKIINE